jgi:uncharacterized protein (TIGR02996 family)
MVAALKPSHRFAILQSHAKPAPEGGGPDRVRPRGREAAGGSPMREAFEQAILDHPDEVANYAAYADWLTEQGDPRGEFIQVQLALEDETRPAAERAALQERENELQERHEEEWLGPLTPHLLSYYDDTGRPWSEHRWQRGFLASLRVQCFTTRFAQMLATAPAARFLRELRVFGEARYFSTHREARPPDPQVPLPEGVRRWELLELIGAPCLRNLRIFQMGDVDLPYTDPAFAAAMADPEGACHTYAPGLEHVLAGMPRLEELILLCKEYDIDHLFGLPNLSRLRVLRLYHFGAVGTLGPRQRYEYPLDVLAANTALGNLAHLLFHPHSEESLLPLEETEHLPSFLPLEQVQALVQSPHLPRLTHLQLRLSNMGDDGVRLLIDSGMLRRLRWLDLQHGCITDEGARLLAACPDLRNLEHLNLSRNAVSAAGLALLQATGVTVRAEYPLTPGDLAADEYLFEGDSE